VAFRFHGLEEKTLMGGALASPGEQTNFGLARFVPAALIVPR
jgi:hypothetical protein